MEIQKANTHSLSIPMFLLSVFKEVMLENPCNHKLLVLALHAIFIESGFVQFDAGSGTRADRFHLSAEWPTTSPMVSLLYTLPAILQNGTNGLNGVILTFSNTGRCLNVYTKLFVGGSDPYQAHLSTDLFGPIVRSLYDNDGTVVERKVVAFWNAVKDGIVLPVLTDLCAAAGLPAPASFMKLPEVIQLKILDLLPAEDLAMMSCVCKELRDVVDDDELWRQKVYDEFGDEVLFPPN